MTKVLKPGPYAIPHKCPNEESNGYCYGKFPSAEPSQLELFPFTPRCEWELLPFAFEPVGDIEIAYLLGWIDTQLRRRLLRGFGNESEEPDA